METGKVICDTDVLIDFFDISKLRHNATKNIIENIIGLDNVVISAITKWNYYKDPKIKLMKIR